ncbi:unnamed protein product [Blepharisma stoltei]|uniref:RING-type domain-containing protein n=1 Tax=Blepharisma stoltei TaxID=1481888 RepID=A0AAU9JRP6_9CILI|nr:unnamed protein product [Blepharisma stoltei]
MQKTLINTPINLKFKDGDLQLQSLQQITSVPYIAELYYERLTLIDEFPYLIFLFNESMVTHICALFSEVTDSDQTKASLHFIERMLSQGIDSSGHIMMAEFINPSNDFIYLMAHVSDRPGLGSFFDGYKFALFKFTISELFGEHAAQYMNYIKWLRIENQAQINAFRGLKDEFAEKVNEQHHYFQSGMSLCKEIKERDENILKTQEIIRNLNIELEEQHTQIKTEELKIECYFCGQSLKKVIFLPCNHIVTCKDCCERKMNLKINSKVNRRITSILCPICKAKIREAHEIYF